MDGGGNARLMLGDGSGLWWAGLSEAPDTKKLCSLYLLFFHPITVDQNSHYDTLFKNKFIPLHNKAIQIILSLLVQKLLGV